MSACRESNADKSLRGRLLLSVELQAVKRIPTPRTGTLRATYSQSITSTTTSGFAEGHPGVEPGTDCFADNLPHQQDVPHVNLVRNVSSTKCLIHAACCRAA